MAIARPPFHARINKGAARAMDLDIRLFCYYSGSGNSVWEAVLGISGQQPTGTAVTFQPDGGAFGGRMVADFPNSTSNYITIDPQANKHYCPPLPLTVLMRVKPKAIDSANHSLFANSFSATVLSGISVGFANNNKFLFSAGDGVGGASVNQQARFGATTPVINTWYDIAGVCSANILVPSWQSYLTGMPDQGSTSGTGLTYGYAAGTTECALARYHAQSNVVNARIEYVMLVANALDQTTIAAIQRDPFAFLQPRKRLFGAFVTTPVAAIGGASDTLTPLTETGAGIAGAISGPTDTLKPLVGASGGGTVTQPQPGGPERRGVAWWGYESFDGPRPWWYRDLRDKAKAIEQLRQQRIDLGILPRPEAKKLAKVVDEVESFIREMPTPQTADKYIARATSLLERVDFVLDALAEDDDEAALQQMMKGFFFNQEKGGARRAWMGGRAPQRQDNHWMHEHFNAAATKRATPCYLMT